MRLRRAAIAPVGGILVLTALAYAQQTSNTGSVQVRLGSIEARLATIEDRLTQLEKGQTQGTSAPAPQAGLVNWRDRSQWRVNLRRGMTKDAVRSLFGEPDKVAEFSDGSCWWHYGYPDGGHLEFGAKGLIVSWTEP